MVDITVIKAIPLQAWTGLDRPLGLQEDEASRISRQLAREGGKVVSPAHRTPLPSGNIPGTRFF